MSNFASATVTPHPFTPTASTDTFPQRSLSSSSSGADAEAAAYAEAMARALTCTPFAMFQREWTTRVQLFALNVLLVGAVVLVGLVGNALTGLVLARDSSRSPMNFLLQTLIACASSSRRFLSSSFDVMLLNEARTY